MLEKGDQQLTRGKTQWKGRVKGEREEVKKGVGEEKMGHKKDKRKEERSK